MLRDGTRFFAEHTRRWHVRLPAQGQREVSVTDRAGACIETHEVPGEVGHRFADGIDLLPALGRDFPLSARKRVELVLASPFPELLSDELDILAAIAEGSGRTITWAGMRQRVACGPLDRLHLDERVASSVEMEVGDVAKTPLSVSLPKSDLPDTATRQVSRKLTAHIDFWASLPEAHTVPSACDIGMPPGRAGALFHELVGHPMEGDVVASGTSYLQPLMGQQVGPEWLQVTDGADHDQVGFRARTDDEGTTCGRAELIRDGVITEPMVDLATADLTGWPTRGHGRRLDYRHPSVVRMAHTVASVSAEATPWHARGDWIEAVGVELCSMAMASGDFVFRIRLPLLHRPDGSTFRLPPISLTGNGLTVLSQLRPGQLRVGSHFRATGGCGKLGQYPLLVSFANAGLWLPAGTVELAEAPDG